MIDIKNVDCIEGLKKLNDKVIDLVIIDPPYNIETRGAGIYNQADKQYVKELVNISNSFDEQILNELIRVMKKINIYIFCSQKQLLWLMDYFINKHNCNFNLLTWHKTNPVPACGNKYLSDTEYILFFREKGVKIYGEFKTKFTYYISPLNQKDKKLWGHPTMKPINLLERFINNSSLPNDTVLDCFMGSGSTAIACKKMNRNCLGFELNKEYYDISQMRLKQNTI